MDFDLNVRSAKWKSEQETRRAAAKERLKEERSKKEAVRIAQKELENIKRQNEEAKIAQREALELEELQHARETGGIEYNAMLEPKPIALDGDAILLPVSALEKLISQEAYVLGKFTFELRVLGSEPIRMTHASVLEFIEEEGKIGLSPKVARSLFQGISLIPKAIQVRFVRLERGQSAVFQPRKQGFGNCDLDFKELLERSLKWHATLTIGDVLFIRHGRKTIEIKVMDLKPESAVSILNTDLEVDMQSSEEIMEREKKEQKRQASIADAEHVRKEKELLKKRFQADRTQNLEPEPTNDKDLQVKINFRFPDGTRQSRRFLHTQLLRHVYRFVEAIIGEEGKNFQLIAHYPKRTFQYSDAGKSLQMLKLDTAQETLFVDQLAFDADEKCDPNEEISSFKVEEQKWPELWITAQKEWESLVDASLNSQPNEFVHAIELSVPLLSDKDPMIRYAVQLEQLKKMGFPDTQLNISILDRYHGRLLRTINYLAELAVPLE